jgi:hypothetical protein
MRKARMENQFRTVTGVSDHGPVPGSGDVAPVPEQTGEPTPPAGQSYATPAAGQSYAVSPASQPYAAPPVGHVNSNTPAEQGEPLARYGSPLESSSNGERSRRSRGAKSAVWLLSAALLLLLAAGAWLTLQYLAAQDQISEQENKLQQQEDEIEEQRELIEEKESFGAAMAALMMTTQKFDGVLTASVVPWGSYERLAERAWAHRWDVEKLAADTGQVEFETEQLEQAWAEAHIEVGSNASGTTFEAVIDSLGGGFVRSVLDNDSCDGDDSALGCVYENDPFLVHFDADEHTQPFMTDEIRTGIAYHEFAHVLQFTNPEATEVAVVSFGGDWEVMADCFALTYLPGWALDHVVWTSSYEYWEVSIGYGVACSEPQRQAVRDWYGQLGVQPQTVGAEG